MQASTRDDCKFLVGAGIGLIVCMLVFSYSPVPELSILRARGREGVGTGLAGIFFDKWSHARSISSGDSFYFALKANFCRAIG